ncbi:hypothetical protein B4U80_04191 [Leptotrombidium deliense]|uniref:PDZ domain-containing protein n=1 Tax=Leptotrombidium deliense TaxID=299467 RepID=A0A443SGM9_9ACAR|nr:hypothetical protein B4U80_04191 [Leptotrombidium deliense]
MSSSESKVSTESVESIESSSKKSIGSKLGLVTVCDNFVKNGSKFGLTSKPEPMRLRLTPDRLILQKEVPECETDSCVTFTDNTSSSSSSCVDSLSECRVVQLTKDKCGLGINVKGGSEHNLPILISSLIKSSPAEKSGQLFIGDAILRVNDVCISTMSHEQAIKQLKNAGNHVTLTVKHFKVVSPFLNKCWRKRLEWQLPRINNNKKENRVSAKRAIMKTKWVDVISVDLLCCYVSKYIHDTDKVRQNGFEIRWFAERESCDRNADNCGQRKVFSSAIVTCNDSIIYDEWRSEIDNYVHNVTEGFVKLVNEKLVFDERVLFMGWISEGFPSSKQEPHRPCYRWTTKYMVIKGGDLYLYTNPGQFLNDESATQPKCKSQTSLYDVISGDVRVYRGYQSVLRCLKRNELVDEREYCFLVLTSDLSGNKSTQTHSSKYSSPIGYFSVETGHDLLRIKNAWNKAIYYSVTQLGCVASCLQLNYQRFKKVSSLQNASIICATLFLQFNVFSKTFAVIAEGRSGSLTLDWRIGFAFYDPKEKSYIWTFKFSQLKNSSDDGNNKLWLHFHSQRENNNRNNHRLITKELIVNNLQSLLYCMHSFLSAKVAAVDPQFDS